MDATRISGFLIGAALAAGGPAAAQNPGPDAAARAAVSHALQAWRGVRTVRATFAQTVTNALTGTSAHAEGEYVQRRPDRLSIRFSSPDGDRIVADGRWVWVYLPSSTPGQVVKQPMDSVGRQPLDLTGEFLDRPFARYRIADDGAGAVDGRPVRVVRLVPTAAGPRDFTRATVWIDDADGYIRQFEVVQTDGVTRRIRLTSLQVNVPVADSAFRFTVPHGVRVVGAPGR